MRRRPVRVKLVMCSLLVVSSLALADWGGATAIDEPDAAHLSTSGGCPLLDGAAATLDSPEVDVDPTPARSPLPDVVTDARLGAMQAALRELPGFRDIHFMLQGTPRFVAWFDADATVPAALPVLDAPYPVVARNLDPGLSQSLDMEAARATDPPLVPGPCGNTRPGGALGACTMAFQLRDGSGALYVATAGHCIVSVGQSFSFGTAVFKRADGIGEDFGLVRVDPVAAPAFEPAMCHWGGPTSGASTGGLGDVVRIYGHGTGVGEVDATRPRSGVLESVGATSFTYVGPVMAGDSGAPVRLDAGPALGVHTHGFSGVNPATLPTSTPTIKWGTRMDAGIEMAEAALGVDLTLVTAPVA